MARLNYIKCDNPGCPRPEPIPSMTLGPHEVHAVIEVADRPSPFLGGKPSVDLDFCSWACLLNYLYNV